MKKAKRILALVLAVVMVGTIFTTTGVAKTAQGDYTSYKTNPTNYFNEVQKVEFTAEQGACWALDMLDDLLYNANIAFDGNEVFNKLSIKVKLYVYLRNIDEALWSIYNLIKAVKEQDSTCVGNVLYISTLFGEVGSGTIGTVVGWFEENFGELINMNVTALSGQNSTNRVCRGNPAYDTTGRAGTVTPNSDLLVVKMLLQFLSDNRNVLKMLSDPNGKGLNLNGTFGDLILDALPSNIKPLLQGNLVGFLKDLLYSKLWDSSVETAPSGWTYDTGLQTLINWLLISGTGEAPSNGGYSILGSNFEAFLPAMENCPGAASIDGRNIQANRGNGVQTYQMNFYQFVNNAIMGLMNGYVYDLLYGLLIKLADVDDSDGLGDPAVLQSGTFSMILGIVEGLFEQCGAPAFNYTDNAKTYPVKRIEELLDWLINRGGLGTFIDISYNGLEIKDAFVVLLRRVLLLLPSLMPLLGLDIPDGIIHTVDEFSELVMDEPHGIIYETFDGVEVYVPNYVNDIPLKEQYFEYVADNTAVNTTDSTQSNYVVPEFIIEKHVVPESAVWGDILKVVLYSVIDGCYFPEWADTIAEVGAYGLASLAAVYLPENNYFDRLDAYHYLVELGESSYTPKGTTGSVTPLPYTEQITISMGNNTTKTVTVPRAAADIGASLGAFFVNGAFAFSQTLGFTPETDTNFETYLAEFLLWGAQKYMPLLTGQYDPATGKYVNLSFGTGNSAGTVKGTWQDRSNTFLTAFKALRTQYAPSSSLSSGFKNVNNIPAADMRAIIYPFIDDTLFKLIPSNWLPTWLSGGGSSALFNYWLGDSLIDVDLQQIASLLTVNDAGELGQNSVTKVIINLLDRILGLLLGGNAVLPTCAESNDRNVFNQVTSITNFENFLGNKSTVQTFLQMFLYYLNRYGNALLNTVLPIVCTLVFDTVKGVDYKEAGATQTSNYINNNHITLDMLQDYIDYYNEDHNNVLFSGKIYYPTMAKANSVARDIGVYGKEGAVGSETVNGATKYFVNFPETYNVLSEANSAAEYIAASLKERADQGETLIGTECKVESKRTTVNGLSSTVYSVYQEMDYKAATANLSVSYTYEQDGTTVKETIYNYSNFNRATPNPRSGSLGEVEYGNGYILLDREDYSTDNIKYLNRRNNAVEDAEDFIGDFNDYVDELCSAYGTWLMFLVNLQLKGSSIYDKNGDGVVNDNDGFPSTPGKKTPYPFYNGSGYSTEVSWSVNEQYPYNYATKANSAVIKAAFERAEDPENDVELSAIDTESVVRLALGNLTFDITKDASGNYYTGTKQWADLSQTQLDTIATKCSNLGLKFTRPADGEPGKIFRPAFNTFKTSNGGYTSFGSYEGSSVSFTPLTTYNKGATGDGPEFINEMQQSYITFAKKIREMDEGAAEHYDDISWRASVAENKISTSYKLNAINWALNYTQSAYYPAGTSNPRNKRYNQVDGTLVSAYTRATYAPFQQAYDYAKALRDYMASGNAQHVAQSLVSVVYRDLMMSYYRLKVFEGGAKWEQLLGFIDFANSILDSDIGLNANGTAKDPDHGYTAESLINLRDATLASQALYNEFAATYDADYQSIIDNYANELHDVIDALEFAAGVVPDILISETYTGSISKANYDPTQANDHRTLGILYGFEEGVGLTPEIFDSGIFIPIGYTVNEEADNTFTPNGSGRGWGTGAYIHGMTPNGENLNYAVVIRGDINGDTRIDGNDKVAMDSIKAQNKESTIPVYQQAACDVNGDGQIDAVDVNIVKAHYTYQTVGNVTGEISQTSSPVGTFGIKAPAE